MNCFLCWEQVMHLAREAKKAADGPEAIAARRTAATLAGLPKAFDTVHSLFGPSGTAERPLEQVQTYMACHLKTLGPKDCCLRNVALRASL